MANLLSSLVSLVQKGMFDDVLHPSVFNLKPHHIDTTCAITTKLQLLQRLYYYLTYLTCFSPTEGDLFSRVDQLRNDLNEIHMKGNNVDTTLVPVRINRP